MKNTISIAICVFSLTTLNAQWEQLGQEIFGDTGDSFTGTSVAMDDSGDIVAVYDSFINGTNAGRVRVFELQNNTWSQIGNDIPGLIGYGESDGRLRMNASGTRIILGNSNHDFNGFRSGAVRVFELQNGSWIQLGTTLYGADEDYFYGTDVDIDAEGNTIIIGANQTTIFFGEGFVDVFELDNNNWVSKGQRIIGSAQDEETGTSVSINDNGDIIAVASPNNDSAGSNAGKVEIFEFIGNSWILKGNSIYGENAKDAMGLCSVGGSAIDLSDNGTKIAISSIGHIENSSHGQVQIFEFGGGIWSQIGSSILGPAQFSYFGQSVELNASGNIVIIGAPFEDPIIAGSARVFKYVGSNWLQIGDTLATANGGEPTTFGYSTAINDSGDKIAVGVPLKEVNTNQVGSVIAYDNDAILSIETPQLAEIMLYPNPNTGRFSLDFSEEFEVIKVEVIDVLGKLIYFETNIPSEYMEIDHNFSSGVYFVNVSTKNSEAIIKMIVE